MRRAIIVVLLALLASPLAPPLSAQQATNTVPVTRNAEDNYRTESYTVSRDSLSWRVEVSVRDSGGAEIRRITFSGPDATHAGATALAFVTQQMTAVGGETGSNARRMDARILQFLITQGYLTGVTLVP